MNYKALALGAVVGFLAALSPACGPDTNECNASNCNTCCTAEGACVAATNDQACGASGNACVACPTGQACSATGACVPVETDGGGNKPDAGNKCEDNCPTGCCNDKGQCMLGTSASACGTGGAACDSCAMGEQCGVPAGQTVRQCFTPAPVDAGTQVGAACDMNSDCADIGTNATCVADGTAGEFMVGMCTQVCDGSQGSCPAGSDCFPPEINGKSIMGQTDPMCLASCDDTDFTSCGEGFFCAGVCLPLTPMPAGQLGKACTSGDECSLPPTNGACLPNSVFPGGMCSAICDTGNNCGDNGVCVGGLFSDADVCLLLCDAPNARGNCPSKYSCYELTGGAGACLPDCTQPGWECDTGFTCNNSTGQCDPA